MNCPVCGKPTEKEKNPNPNSEMHVFSTYGRTDNERGETEYFDGPVIRYQCEQCKNRFYLLKGVKDIKQKRLKYYEIIGGYTKEVIGKCTDEGLEHAAKEDPGVTFRRISKKDFDKEMQ